MYSQASLFPTFYLFPLLISFLFLKLFLTTISSFPSPPNSFLLFPLLPHPPFSFLLLSSLLLLTSLPSLNLSPLSSLFLAPFFYPFPSSLTPLLPSSYCVLSPSTSYPFPYSTLNLLLSYSSFSYFSSSSHLVSPPPFSPSLCSSSPSSLSSVPSSFIFPLKGLITPSLVSSPPLLLLFPFFRVRIWV